MKQNILLFELYKSPILRAILEPMVTIHTLGQVIIGHVILLLENKIPYQNNEVFRHLEMVTQH